MRANIFCLISMGLALSSGAAMAEIRDVFLEEVTGARIKIAELDLAPDGSYTLTMEEAPFTDHFLSMRPFKCLTGKEKHWCYVPYPYENKRQISEEFTDLEYDLLFIWKGATEYGINMWNGVYYKIEEGIENNALTGVLNEMNMDILAIPPEDGNLRPILPKHIEPGEPSGHWLPHLVIE